MEDEIADKIILNSKRQIEWVNQFKKHRYLYSEIQDIDPEYYVGIKGFRGVGKTVLMLQIAKETKNAVYFSADSTLIQSYSLYEIINEMRERGFENIFVDEIHLKDGWGKDIKTIYDEHNTRVMFSGSSALDISQTNLGRRAIVKKLKPASFREFLNIRKGYNIPKLSFDQIKNEKIELVQKYGEFSERWEEYMRYGGVLYPKNGFFGAFENSLRKVIVQDLSALRNINVKYESDAYRLLHLIAKSPPFEMNYSTISQELDISKNFAIRLVKDLQKADVVKEVLPCKKENVDVKKEPKIYLRTPLRMFYEEKGVNVNLGSLREEFFVNNIEIDCYFKGKRGEKKPDFRFNDKVVEIGGKSKSRHQNPDYIAVDGLSTKDNRIPLFLFGFLY